MSPVVWQWVTNASMASRNPPARNRPIVVQPPHRARPAADVAEHEPHHRQPGLVDLVAVGADPPVVAEPVRQLVRVGDAPDPGQQRHVVDRGLLLLGQAGEPRPAGGDDRLAEHVLLGLAEPEVGRERQRRDELGQASPARPAPIWGSPALESARPGGPLADPGEVRRDQVPRSVVRLSEADGLHVVGHREEVERGALVER